MGKRLILFILALCCFVFLFYLRSYQNSFVSSDPLNFSSIAKTKKNFLEEKARLELLASHQGEEDAQKETTPVEEVVVIDLNDPLTKKGHQIYHEVGQCITCHGDQGQGNAEKEAPLVAGQMDWYVYEQLLAFKNGIRKNEAMMPFIANLTISL
jgi:cytochrome c553